MLRNLGFNKYRVNADLDYPDASSCYFITDSWSANGHTRYREMLFDPNEGYLLFSYLRGETHAGFVVESRFYYGANGNLVEQKHKVAGKDATPDAHTWSSAEDDKELAANYLDIFDALMNSGKQQSTLNRKQLGKPNPDRIKYIRGVYTKTKEKIAKNDKSEMHNDLLIVIRDQSWGPPETTDLKYYIDDVDDSMNAGVSSNKKHCYFISKHLSNNNMGKDCYSEYLLSPDNHNLIFSYTCAKEEGEKNEWRYYFDKNGQCIEVKTNAEEQDNGDVDQITIKRYIDIFNKLCEMMM